MSWDIWLATELDGHEVEVCESTNYTHNTNAMIREAGFTEFPYGVDGWTADRFTSCLFAAIEAMRSDRPKFRAMNPANGWGDADHLIEVLTTMADKFDRFPSAIVRVSA